MPRNVASCAAPLVTVDISSRNAKSTKYLPNVARIATPITSARYGLAAISRMPARASLPSFSFAIAFGGSWMPAIGRSTAPSISKHNTSPPAESSIKLLTPPIRTSSGTANAPTMRATTSPVPIRPNKRFACRTS